MVLATPQETSWRSNADVAAALGLLADIDARRRLCPAEAYEPHHTVLRSPFDQKDAGFDRKGLPSGQLQFHQSRHPARIIGSGNGWGGTSAMACEVDAWMRHTNRWQETPAGPLQAIWFCPMFQQFAMLRDQLIDMAFGRIPKYFVSGERRGFEWPDGSHLFLGSYDTSWDAYQGIQPHLIVFDEQPPPPLWREMRQRRRDGNRLTRFICKATQTKGWSWMGEDIYLPWLRLHQERGHDEEAAMREQLHPFFWVWPKGGIHDNPAVPDEICREKEAEAWPTPKERKVRLYGGFERWHNHGVFDADALDYQRTQAALWLKDHPERQGSLVLVRKERLN